MKDITSTFDRIARVHCSCCGYDEHFVDIFFNKDFDSKDPDEPLFYFEFDVKDDIYMFPDLRTRIKNVKRLFTSLNHIKANSYFDSIIINFSQLKEVYAAMEEQAKYRIDLTVDPKRPVIQQYVDKSWVETFFFKGDDGLVLVSNSVEFGGIRSVYANDFEIGWTYPQSYSAKYIRRHAVNWILKRSKVGVRKFSCALNEKETEMFLLSVKYIIDNIKHDEQTKTNVI